MTESTLINTSLKRAIYVAIIEINPIEKLILAENVHKSQLTPEKLKAIVDKDIIKNLGIS
jgi:hypothetical protein